MKRYFLILENHIVGWLEVAADGTVSDLRSLIFPPIRHISYFDMVRRMCEQTHTPRHHTDLCRTQLLEV
jgi:hypothetical protein